MKNELIIAKIQAVDRARMPANALKPSCASSISKNLPHVSRTEGAMTRIQHPLELLAPAKNADFGIEAIKHGADAVYIGGPAFGARYGAGNDVADIERLCEFAHRYRAKVFVALNTILHDDGTRRSRRQMAWQLTKPAPMR
jgi:hypothetical protein